MKFEFPKKKILTETTIRTISPWSYIGGDGEGQSYPLLINLLASIIDLVRIDLYIDHVYPYPSENGITEPVRDQSALLSLVISNLKCQTCLKSINIFKTFQKFPVHSLIPDLFTQLQSTLKSISLVGFGPKDAFDAILISVAQMDHLESLMLDNVPIDEAPALGTILKNKKLRALTLRVENLKEIAEKYVRAISILPLRILRLSGNLYLHSDQILTALNPLSSTLVDLMLEGNWVNDRLITALPSMPRLEALRIVPTMARISTNSSVANRVSTSVVLDFAQKCPVLTEPRFLRNVRMLKEMSREDPESAYHPDWRVYCQSGSRPIGPRVL